MSNLHPPPLLPVSFPAATVQLWGQGAIFPCTVWQLYVSDAIVASPHLSALLLGDSTDPTKYHRDHLLVSKISLYSTATLSGHVCYIRMWCVLPGVIRSGPPPYTCPIAAAAADLVPPVHGCPFTLLDAV